MDKGSSGKEEERTARGGDDMMYMDRGRDGDDGIKVEDYKGRLRR